MTNHTYAVGQSVNLSANSGLSISASAVYEIVAILPQLGNDFQYRLRCVDETHERVVAERQIASVLTPNLADDVFRDRKQDSQS